MAEWNVYNKNCPTRLVLDRIADKWTVLTVGALAEETKRFGQLRRELDGISWLTGRSILQCPPKLSTH